MADPLSIIGICAVALKAVVQAKDFVENIHRAPSLVQSIADDLKAIEGLLRELGTLLEGTDLATHAAIKRWVQTAQTSCEEIMKEVNKLIRPYTTRDKAADITIWKRFSFTFRSSGVAKLQRDMASCKQTLNLAITCASL